MEFEEFDRLFRSETTAESSRKNGVLYDYNISIRLVYSQVNSDDLTPEDVERYRQVYASGELFGMSLAQARNIRDLQSDRP